ncbi:MAG TPA: phage baseplate assembly protein V [Cellvibrionaceae bacterium]|nr:phage baseplate assembly protein V [Cellvibrionaceae bacterium]
MFKSIVRLLRQAKRPRAQLSVLAGELQDDAEHVQPYGFASAPHLGAEGFGAYIGGGTAHAVVLVIDDRRYRLTSLQPGEVSLFDDLGQRVTLTRTGIELVGLEVRITAEDKITMIAPTIETTGALKNNGKAVGSDLKVMNVQPGSGTSDGVV